ncbi:MAG: GNAT family N-acetyltransferase [Agathobacter sp.]|nr:GNAT family N-acetyltransferase [Agathobacter sp.]
MFGLKLIKKATLAYYEDICQSYYKERDKNKELNKEVEDVKELMIALQKRLVKPNIIIFDIKNDKNGVISYICVIDNRLPSYDQANNKYYFCGDLDIFVANRFIQPSNIIDMFVDMPHMRTTFTKEVVRIDELRTKIKSRPYYEGKGYGLMMIEALESIAKCSNCTKIEGILSSVDAETIEIQNNRDDFYKKRGFDVKVDKHGNGHLKKNIQSYNSTE